MLALKSNTGFEVMDSDELYFINGGSGSFHIGTYNDGQGKKGCEVTVTWTNKNGEDHGFEVHAGVEQGHVDIGGSWY